MNAIDSGKNTLSNLKISVVADNRAATTFLAEHGLSFLIKADGKTILFDSGQGAVIEHNLKELCCAPEDIDALVLSHGHYDHTGGLGYLAPRLKKDIKIYLHPSALKPKYSKIPGDAKYIGMPDSALAFCEDRKKSLVMTSEPTEIFPGIFATGSVPRVNSMEKRSTKFYLGESLTEPDTMLDDQALFFRTEKGIVVLLGCCHAGLKNTLDYIAKIAETKKIYAVIGGTHLRSANIAQLDFAADAVKEYGIRIFAPCHCSGEKSSAYLYCRNPEIFSECHTGASFVF